MFTQFKVSIIADWGRGDIAKRVFRALKARQTSLTLLEYRLYVFEGEPFLNVALLELPVPIALLNAQIFFLKTMRDLYKHAPLVVHIEAWDGEELEDAIGPYVWEGAFNVDI